MGDAKRSLWPWAILGFCLLVLAGVLSACRPGAPEPAPAASATALLSPTAPAEDTSTPAPLATATEPAEPTDTPALPTATPEAAAWPSEGPYPDGSLWLSGQRLGGRQPEALARLGEDLYVLSRRDDRLLIVRAGQVAVAVPIGEQCGVLAADEGSGLVYVADEAEKALYVVRGEQVEAIWNLDGTPAALLAREGRLYVGFSDPAGVTVLDAATGRKLDAYGALEMTAVLSLALDKAAGRLYVAGYQQALAFDLASHQVVQTQAYNNYRLLAVDEARGRWYINDYAAEANTQWLVALDAASGAELGRVPVGVDPWQALVDPGSGRVYVSNSWSQTISVIDGKTLQALASVPVGRRPVGMLLDAEAGRLYVALAESDSVAVLDIQTRTLEGVMPMALIPSEMLADPRRGYVYAAVPAANMLFVWQDAAVVRRVPLGLAPQDIALSDAEGALYAVNAVSQSVTRVDLSTWETRDLPLAQAAWSLALDEPAGMGYAGTQPFSLGDHLAEPPYVLHGALGAEVEPQQIETDPAGGRLILVAYNGIPGSNGGMVLYAVAPATGEQSMLGLGGLGVSTLALDGAGRRLFATGGRYAPARLYVGDLDALEPLADRPLEHMPTDLAFVPASRHLFVPMGEDYEPQSDRLGWLQVLDADTLGEVARWDIPGRPAQVAADVEAGRIYLSVGLAGQIVIYQDALVPAPPAPTITPIVTPWPTATPQPTATPAAAPQAIPSPPACLAVPEPLEPYWTPELEAELGCLMRFEAIDMVEQPFERGRMLWRADIPAVYVLTFDDDQFTAYEDVWKGPAEESCAGDPPADVQQPVRGFGLVWCQVEGLKGRIGWALEPERGLRGVAVYTERNLLLLTDRGQAYIFYAGGRWRVLSKP